MCNCSHHLILVVSMPLMAHDLCAGKDPCCMAYDESLMRSHLEPQCYESEKLSHFPRARRSCSRRIYKDVQVAVYCICHFPDVERFGHMAECDTCKLWYHQICLNIPDRVFKKTRSAKWTCSECSYRLIIKLLCFLIRLVLYSWIFLTSVSIICDCVL